MANKMLIDASHPEETRVVVLRGNRVQEFDFEAADKKPLRGNIYLAKVTRVEPSLQAAFVDYGGNRHGFLAFAEIHPDYYQIPVADRIALLEEESRAHRQADEEEHHPRQTPREGRGRRSRRRQHDGAEKRARSDEAVVSEVPRFEDVADLFPAVAPLIDDEAAAAESISATPVDHEQASPAPVAIESEAPVESAPENDAPVVEAAAEVETPVVADDAPIEAADIRNADDDAEVDDDQNEDGADEAPHAAHETISVDPAGFGSVEEGAAAEFSEESAEPDHEIKARRQDERDEEAGRGGEDHGDDDGDHDDEADHVEHIGGDAMDEAPFHHMRPRRQYKIQEVIKRRQVLLVQVVKEERGNKGAALTTYLSLAGRYSVLMPNTARGGGISRKITDGADRKRLKEIVHDLEVPEGMGVILRTAGAARTKQEVKRDFEYLLRLWESVRELTLRSSAPTLVYEEGSLIKRAIRDLYGREVEEIVVSGDEAYLEARNFMKMLMPSHVRNVRQHPDQTPLFADAGVEAQLDAMFSNHVTLKSGGYLVINQTEALVAIDVNSGRSTREHNIEDTALRTNLEASDEVARQLRLRDLAGLIVVDFIDMEEGRNNRAVERRLKEALKNDRARIQVGRISHFGLLEMSRQRIRAGVVEGSTVPCPHCVGAGTVRSTASIALHVLRVLEEALLKSSAHDVTLRTRAAVALYILNQKRDHLQQMEHRFGVHITVGADDTLTGANYHALERGELASGPRSPSVGMTPLRVDSLAVEPFDEDEAEEDVSEPAFEREREGERDQRRREPREVREPREPRAPRERVEASDEEDADGAQRSRRRRRRRGRGGLTNGAPAPQNAEQPSDEGLAFMAAIEGAPAPVDGAAPRDDGGRGRRGRRPGRWTRSSALGPEFRDQGPFPPDAGIEEAFVSPREAHVPPFGDADRPAGEDAPPVIAALPPSAELPPTIIAAAPPPPVETSAPTGVSHKGEANGAEPPPAVETAPAAPEPASEPAPPRPTTEVVITAADHSGPKKGGWWQRVTRG